ncbi:hypothetical protein H4R34_000437 [Dimargaris verticillata]|uniref:DNA replication regulator Sld3 C-terminal domain-containing protein n=1 Tax=Dimargaris verticillata TaxID=2761393 RepID=A0A9W8BBW7_9FUNG|nr:hypothetical protein H4R34_000437 [Dimargaris verticillata]
MDRGSAVTILDRDLDGQGRVCIQVKWSSGIISWEPLSTAANFFHLLEDFEQRCIQERNHKNQAHASAATCPPAVLNSPLVRSQSVRSNLDAFPSQPNKSFTVTGRASSPTPALTNAKQSLPLDTKHCRRGTSLSGSALALITRPSTTSPLRPRCRGITQHAGHHGLLRESASSPNLRALATSKRAPSFDHTPASLGGWQDSGTPQAAEKTNVPRTAPLPKALFSAQAGVAAEQAAQLHSLYSEIMFDFALPLADIMYPFHSLLREKDWDQFQILRKESLASVLALTRSLSQLEDKYRDSVYILQSQFIGHCSSLAALPLASERGPCSPHLEAFSSDGCISAQELSQWLTCFRSYTTTSGTDPPNNKPTEESSQTCIDEATVLSSPVLDPARLENIKASILTHCDRVKLRECQLQIVVHLLYLRLYRLKFKGSRDQTTDSPVSTSNPATAPVTSDDDVSREIHRATARQLAESLVFYIDKICIWSMVGFHTDLFTSLPGAKVSAPSPSLCQTSSPASHPPSTSVWSDPAQIFMESLIVPLFSRDLPDVLKPFRRQCSGTEILTPVHRSRSVLTSPRSSRRASSGSLGRMSRSSALSLFRSRSRTALAPSSSSTGTSPEIIGTGKSKRLLRKPSFVSSYDLRPRENGRVAVDTVQATQSPALGPTTLLQRTDQRNGLPRQGTGSPLALNPIGYDSKPSTTSQPTGALRRMARMFSRSPMQSPSKHPASSGRAVGGSRSSRQLDLGPACDADKTESPNVDQISPAATNRSSTPSLPKSLLNKRVVAIPHSVAGKRSLRTVTHRADKRKQSAAKAANSQGTTRSLLKPSTYLSGTKRKRDITPMSPKSKRSAVCLLVQPKGPNDMNPDAVNATGPPLPDCDPLPPTEPNPLPTPDPVPRAKAHPFIRTIRQLTNQTGLFGIRKPPPPRALESDYPAAGANPQVLPSSKSLDACANPMPADALPDLQSPTGISVAVVPHQPMCSDADAEVVMAPGAHMATRLQRQGSVRRRLDFFL